MQQSTIWVGLDVHKNSITAAILEGDESHAEIVQFPSGLNKVRKLFRKLSDRGNVRSCYEASGAGFVLYRALTEDGFSCEVIAPSLMPHKPGDRRKTDRIDAINLAKHLRSGLLTPIEIPSEEQEAIRGLVRYRRVLKNEAKRTKHRICGFLLRQGLSYKGGQSNWTKKYRIWLARCAVSSKAQRTFVSRWRWSTSSTWSQSSLRSTTRSSACPSANLIARPLQRCSVCVA